MHITLTGNLGSGKSTICRILEDQYGFEIYSTGKVQRKLAEEMGLTVLEMNQRMCSDPSYDHKIDDTVARISREQADEKICFDSRLAWHFAEKSFKVFLSVDINEAARRVFNDNRGDVEKYKDQEDAKAQLIARAETEDKRYHEIYGINYFDFNNYNLVLDSTNCTPEFLAERILKEHDAYIEGDGFYADHSCKLLIGPSRLYKQGTRVSFPAGPKSSETAYDANTALKCKKVEDGNFELEEEACIGTDYPLVQLYI
ncbi:MAG: dephospho-CoA kinase [Lachnospiraceae bacterium]|nr:dephospho-CoA kinase [Lachnospiraceae bacterium]